MKGYMPNSYLLGASLEAWKDFFPAGSVHGRDVQPDCMLSEPWIATRLCDSTDAESCRAWIEAHPDLEFDIIVDETPLTGTSTSWPR
jgi:hypothetical protein